MRCLLILVLIGLVGQAMGYKEFNLKLSEKYELKDLVGTLGSALPAILFRKYQDSLNPDAHMVADTLAKAEKKKEEIYNHITINQLLALNEWTVDDCTEFKFEERRETCLKFCTEEETSKTGHVLLHAPQPFKGDELLRYNLGIYCWYLLEQVQKKCPSAQMKEAKKQIGGWLSKDAWRLSNFNHLVENHIADNKIPVHELAANGEANYKRAVEEVFAKNVKKKSDRDYFKKLCQVVAEKIGKVIHLEEVDQKMRDYHSVCEIINSIQEVNN